MARCASSAARRVRPLCRYRTGCTSFAAASSASDSNGLDAYAGFDGKVRETKRKLLEFLIRRQERGQARRRLRGAGKGNTLLNFCGIRTDFLDYTVDRSPHKQGRYTPGTHIPICDPDRIRETRPDYVLILPWNLKDEIGRQMSFIRDWGGKFVTAIPETQVFEPTVSYWERL